MFQFFEESVQRKFGDIELTIFFVIAPSPFLDIGDKIKMLVSSPASVTNIDGSPATNHFRVHI